MGRGGKRAGAGRKKGAKNRYQRAAAEAAKAAGHQLPHEILFALGRGETPVGFEKKLGEGERVECLKAAAPFYAPKLLGAVVKTNPNDQNPWAQLMALVEGKSRGLPAEAIKRQSGR